MWWLAIPLLFVVLLVWGYSLEAASRARDRARYPPPGVLFDVGGRRLHLLCSGQRRAGQPTVLLEAGLGSWSFYWRLVQPEAARFARVCAYDRAGMGWSERGPEPRSAERIAQELYALLGEAGESGPYVLVGHSLGGLLVREFARQHPEQVAGMVLVDSAHEDQLQRIPSARRETERSIRAMRYLSVAGRFGLVRAMSRSLLKRFPSVRTPEDKAVFRACLLGSAYFDTIAAESRAMLADDGRGERLGSLGDRPLVVIRAGGRPSRLPAGMTAEQWRELRQPWEAIQEELVGLSSQGRLVVAEKSLHNVQMEQPEVVVEAIREVVAAASSSRRKA